MGIFSSAKRIAPTQYSAEQLRMMTPALAGRESLRSGISTAFDDPARSAISDSAAHGVRDFNLMRLADERAKADREAGFNLARTGQVGGSQDIEGLRDRNRITDDALRSTEADALSAANALRANDAASRARLNASVNSGLGSGDMISQALQSLQMEGDQNLSALRGRAVGDAVSQFGQLAQAYQIGDARQRALLRARELGLPSTGYSGTLYER